MPSVFSKDSTTNIDLPKFDSLLVKGSYPPSAPIHLCLSHIAESGTSHGAVILTPSKEQLEGALLAENDPWLQRNSGTGTVAAISRRINVLYPPTPHHMVFLLSMFHAADPSNDPSWSTKTTFPTPPSLIVLHELSFYFTSGTEAAASSQPTLSSYLDLVVNALAAASSLSKHPSNGTSTGVSLALFDSGMDTLRLPILKVPRLSHPHIEAPGEAPDEPRVEAVYQFARKYFEFILEFTLEHYDEAPQSSTAPARKTVRLLQKDRFIK
ncbi:hypothetical protein PC9H_005098 [Pleurotus ostreatus]|uniref:Uncharacterized protein n=1 Tax=Pleurotus ostreatus TaxID=5322 RepID=A0A8H7DU35_PLEOS|nr:uncharacterized protein PC9H_005098 [Pleurotus ostreatus]KAF7433149.1 hypothetical protein PC9H_005098 [Pleurotus ostreatus]